MVMDVIEDYVGEINPVALIVTLGWGIASYYMMFVVDGVESISLASRVIGMVVSIIGAFFLSNYMLNK